MDVKCPKCGYSFTSIEDVTTCPRCMYQFQTGTIPPLPAEKKRSNRPAIAGVLLITASILGFMMGGFIGFVPGMVDEISTGQTVTVYGTVTDENGNGMGNATVTVLGLGLSSNTSSDGSYRIENVPAGVQRIKAEKDNNSLTIKTFVYEGTNKVDFTLKPGSHEQDIMSEVNNVLYVCSIVIFILSFFTLLGGIFALKRRHFGIAVIGAIMGIPALGFLIGSILSIIALILIVLSRNEFR
ncbi:MAG: carboxypeptidase-like regulatory domain-containing protein [Thermoplasmatales archaeon]|nr:carboxypeptidase-like regulatory domain-containing protein [Thermoplasmatales archaeon]